jgi:hypothetical protein
MAPVTVSEEGTTTTLYPLGTSTVTGCAIAVPAHPAIITSEISNFFIKYPLKQEALLFEK